MVTSGKTKENESTLRNAVICPGASCSHWKLLQKKEI
jgi:hypothetical protein